MNFFSIATPSLLAICCALSVITVPYLSFKSCIGPTTFFPGILRIISQTFLEGVLTLTEDTWFFQESRFCCLNNFLVLAWMKHAHIEFAVLWYLLANLLALFGSFLAAWQSSSNQAECIRTFSTVQLRHAWRVQESIGGTSLTKCLDCQNKFFRLACWYWKANHIHL